MELGNALLRVGEVRHFLAGAGSTNVTRVIEVSSLRDAETFLGLVDDPRVLTAMSFDGQARVKRHGGGFEEFRDPGGPLVFVVPAATLPHLRSDERLWRRLSGVAKPAAAAGRQIQQVFVVLIAIAAVAIPVTLYQKEQLRKQHAAEQARAAMLADAEYARAHPPVEIGALDHDA